MAPQNQENSIDPADGYSVSPLTNTLAPSTSVGSTASNFHYTQPASEPQRRPSLIGFGGSVFTGSSLRHSRENDRLANYVEKSGKLQLIRELRTFRLIGYSPKIFQWELCLKDKAELNTIKNRKLLEFYQDQNDMIEKYAEIDKLLDSGIHHKMIRNYSERNNHDLDQIAEDDEDPIQKVHKPNGYGSTNNGELIESSPDLARPDKVVAAMPSLHRRTSAVPADVDFETDNLLGYNKTEEMNLVDFYIHLNFATNVVLLIGKAIVALLTSSISIVASLIDSALDFLSTVIIFFANLLARSKHSKNFPIGKNRLEPIGVLVFSVIIIISFIQVGLEALNRLIKDADKPIVEVGLNASVIMILTIVSKLGCYIYGKTIKSSSAQALAQDALVDVIFNVFSLLMPLLGHYFQIYWFDPIGALFLSFYIVYLWSHTCFEHIIHLTGHKASPEDYQVILYLCMRFSDKISKIKEINCYHVGDSINVEVDVILDNVYDMRDSHDLAEALQYTLEALPMINIERAFVHTDYEVDNFKGHLRG